MNESCNFVMFSILSATDLKWMFECSDEVSRCSDHLTAVIRSVLSGSDLCDCSIVES